MVATKIYKKCSPNGRLYLYLGQREYISADSEIDDIKGIAYAPEMQELQGKYIFASLIVCFRHGREEDEMMGISFRKELVVDRVQVFPPIKDDDKTKLQTRLMQKLGDGAKPFTLAFPQSAPNSVLIRGEEGDSAQMGVTYEVRLHVGDSSDDFGGAKKSSVNMSIRKSQYITSEDKQRSPTAKAEKGFLCAKGKLGLECTLDKEIFYHGQEIPIHVSINNNANKSVKAIRVAIVQHCELTMVAAQYSCKVARFETKDGCPLGPGANLNRTFTMKPLAQMCGHERGLALDASLSKERDETNLASSSIAETGDPNDLLGVIVSYSVKVTLVLSGMGGELVVDLPFKLNHPKPDSEEADTLEELKKSSAEEAAKLNKRRQRFQAQDSVLVEPLGKSMEE
jgi:arrestin-2